MTSLTSATHPNATGEVDGDGVDGIVNLQVIHESARQQRQDGADAADDDRLPGSNQRAARCKHQTV